MAWHIAESREQAKDAVIPVYTVALGTPEGTVTFDRFGGSRTIPVPPDPVTLEQIADDTEGEFYAAVSGARSLPGATAPFDPE